MTSKSEALAAIDDALDGEDYERALLLASKAVRDHPEDAGIQAAYGDALWSLGDMEDARDAYRSAVKLDPDDVDSWIMLAQIHFLLTDFESAHDAALRSLELEPSVDALDVLSRLAERGGDLEQADELLQRAQALDDEVLIPVRVDAAEFHDLVQKALEDIPERFRAALDDEVAILVEPVPSLELLRAEKPPMAPDLLGLYVGLPLPERSQTAVTKLPDRIHLFQRNLEHVVDNRDDLVESIRITVFHEVGHYFGFSDDELHERGFS